MTSNERRRVLTAVAAACLPLAAASGEPPGEADQRLPETVVTATKTAKGIADAPATVSVVGREDIERANVQSADEALMFLPGVYATRAGGHEPSVMSTIVRLRGIPDYSRTLVLVDGQTLNDPYIGAVSWESVPPELIERIEVVPGPFSSLYGGNAMGGVINIITKVPEKHDILLKAGYGANAFASGTFVYQDRPTENFGVLFDLSYKRSGGYVKDQVVRTAAAGTAGTAVSGWTPTTDPYGTAAYLIGDKGDSPWESLNAGTRLYFRLPEAGKLTVDLARFEYEKQWDRFHTDLRDNAGNPVSTGGVTFNDRGTDRTMNLTESLFLAGPNPKQQNRLWIDYDRPLGGGAQFKASVGYLDTPIYDYVIPKSGATFDGGGPGSRLHRPNSELSANLQWGLPLAERHYLVAGLAAGQRAIETFQYAVSDWRIADATGTTEAHTTGEDRYYALYVQDEIALGERLTAYVGGRYDGWGTRGTIEQLTTMGAIAPYASAYGERSQSYFSPKASLVYRPNADTTWRASAGNAFRPPMLRDTFGWWTPTNNKVFVPNPDLRPETVTAWEVGAERRFGTTRLRVTYYENYLRDVIYRTEDATTQSVANAAEAEIKGVEIEARRRLTDTLSGFANATLNRARFTRNPLKPSTEGKRLTGTPERLANLGVQYQRARWTGSLAAHYIGKVYANDENRDAVDGVYGSYDPGTVVNAKVSYAFNRRLTLALSVDNLLDRRYYQSTLAPGRSVYGEAVWRW